MLRPLLLCAALAALVPAADDKPLPPGAAKAIESYTAAAAKIVAKAQGELGKEKEKLLQALTKEKEGATRKGDLEGALALKARIEEFAAARDATIMEPETDLLGNPMTATDSLDKPRNQIAKDLAKPLAQGLAKLPPEEWEKLGGAAFTLDSRALSTDTGIVLKAGEAVVVVPHPGDQWVLGAGPSDSKPMTWQGDIARNPNDPLRWGVLFVQLGDKPLPCGLVDGPGRLVLKCNDSGAADNQGKVRVKILKVAEK